jgi:Holliday junction resolvase-like predicted endonuclease
MIKHDRTIIHVEVKDTHEHFYFGSAAAMFEDSRVKNLLKIKYQTFRTKRVSAHQPYENDYVIVRKGNLNTIDHKLLEEIV